MREGPLGYRKIKKKSPTTDGRICSLCGQFKTWDKFYPGDGINGKSTRCGYCKNKKHQEDINKKKTIEIIKEDKKQLQKIFDNIFNNSPQIRNNICIITEEPNYKTAITYMSESQLLQMKKDYMGLFDLYDIIEENLGKEKANYYHDLRLDKNDLIKKIYD